MNGSVCRHSVHGSGRYVDDAGLFNGATDRSFVLNRRKQQTSKFTVNTGRRITVYDCMAVCFESDEQRVLSDRNSYAKETVKR